MRTRLPVRAIFFVAVALAGTASAAITVSSWTYETLTTSDSLDPTGDEATVATFNMNGGNAALGGVNFAGAAAGWYVTNGGITMAYSVPGSSWAGGASGSFGSNAVLDSFELTYPSANGTLEFSGLTVGQEYTFQFIAADQRAGTDGRRLQIFGGTVGGADVSGSSDQLRFGYQTIAQYAVISASFTADASGKAAFLPRVFAADGVTSLGTQINAIHIMTVPEPTTALLGCFGSFALLLHRRRATNR